MPGLVPSQWFRPTGWARLLASLAALTLLATLLVAAESTAAPATAAGWEPRPATYGVTVEKDVQLTMSDGVTLVADIRRPATDGAPAPGRFPVIVTQTPYNKNLPGLNFANDYLVERGYVQVVVDVRGTGGSGGTWTAFGEREQRDGYEVVEWSASPQRPWSNGKIGLYGVSYGAINQFFTAAQHPPGLKALFPVVPMGDAYRDVATGGGQFNAAFMPSWLGLVTGAGVLPPSYSPARPADALSTMLAHAGGAASFQLPMLVNAAGGGERAYDGEFFRTRSPLSVVDQVEAPTFIAGGLYDLFQRSQPLLYKALARNGVPAKLLYGPWYHTSVSENEFGMRDEGEPSLRELQLRWFDHHVRDTADPALERSAPISYYEIGSGQWREARRWPPADTSYEPFYLSGSATPASPGTLVRGAPRGAAGTGGPDFVPRVPLAGVCTKSTAQWTAGAGALGGANPCAQDQRLNANTGLSYDYEVTGEPLRLTGPINAHLVVSSPVRDGTLTVRLEDVAPDGTVTQLTAGWQVLSMRALDEQRSVRSDGLIVRPWHPFTRESQEPMPSGTPVAVDVEVFPTTAVVEPGHRLRLAIQNADRPHLLGPVPTELNSAGPGVRLWHDPDHPAWVALPTNE